VYKTIGGTPHLYGNYTVFGEVIEGQDIVDKISLEPRDMNDRPNKDIRIKELSELKTKKKKKFLFF
jgi:cyclophilin family peptidyl-prolyl cis-trans isomerase